MNKSIWKDYLRNNNFKSLQENIETDVLVIGGGITGILITKKLHDNKIKTLLVEKGQIGSGITSKTTAFLTVQHETLFQSFNQKKAQQYLKLNNDALNEYKELSKIYDFDYEETDSCLFSKNYDIINNEFKTLQELHQNICITKNIPFEENCIGVSFKKQATINPIKLINAISKDLSIYENSEIIKLKRNYAILKNNKLIKFKKAIIATHYPIINKHNLLFMKLTQRKSYVVAIKKETIKGTYCSIDEKGLYYRMYKDYLIIGGNDRDTGINCSHDFTKVILEKFNISKEDILYSWNGQDCISLDGIPYIGYNNLWNKNHITVTGFNLWGFTWAMASSNIILNMITKNKECKLTKLNRWFINKNLFKNLKTAIINLINFNKPKCTHLGCRLIYNKKEKIYECPCHGSIYNELKKVIKGPAQKNIK